MPCVTSLWQRILKKLGFPPWISGLPPVWNCELFHIFAVTVRRLFIRSRLLLSPLPGQRLGCCCGAWERWEEVEKEHLLLSYTLLTAADATLDIDSMSVYIILRKQFAIFGPMFLVRFKCNFACWKNVLGSCNHDGPGLNPGRWPFDASPLQRSHRGSCRKSQLS